MDSANTEQNPQSQSQELKPEEKQEQTEPITKYIKSEVAQQIMEMGFSKNVSEKACLFTGSNWEQAIEWIYEHTNDPDFEEEAKIIQESGKPQSTLSPEEAKIKARELQEKLRKNRIEKEKALAEEQEKNRVRSIKELAKAKKLQEETEMKIYLEAKKLKDAEDERYRRELLESMAREKAEKFGKTYDPNTLQEQKKFTKEENIISYCKALKALHPPFRSGDTLKNCFSTLKIIMNNILKNPGEEKFKKVKTTNPNMMERIGRLPLAMKILVELNFVEEGEFMVAKSVDTDLYGKIIHFLEGELAGLN